MLISLCKNLINLTRQTAEVFAAQEATASITVVNGTPLIDANVQITIVRPSAADTKTGTVTIAGNRVDSMGNVTMVSEDLTFPATGISAATIVGVTANSYTNVTTISVSGTIISSSITIKGQYIGADGGNVQVQSTMRS